MFSGSVFWGHMEVSSTDRFTDLVIAILAVNGWNMEKVGSILPSLREARLTDPVTIAGKAFAEIAQSLETAGYKRGNYILSILTERVISAAQYFLANDLDAKLQDLEGSRSIEETKKLLRPIKGVGNFVAEHYLILRGLK